MAFRQLVQGRVGWDRLEAVFREVAGRYEEPVLRVEFLAADNWLSVPCAVDDRWFVKVISEQHSRVHALLTAGRNIGAFSSGTEGFFEHVGTPYEMAQREYEATERMRAIGVNAPEPVDAFELDGLGVLVLEYLPDFRTLGDLSPAATAAHAPALFAALAALHGAGLAHGDLRAENVIVADEDLYFIDATSVAADGIESARPYDLACALAVLAPAIGARAAVAAAGEHYCTAELLAAREFLDFVKIRPDHDFDAAGVKGEIEKVADA